MDENARLLDEIDRYLNDEMTPEERLQFEASCMQDAALDEQVAEHRYFRDLLKGYDDRLWIRNKLEVIREKEKAEQPLTAGYIPRIIAPKRHLWATIAVAAAVALLVAMGGLWSATHLLRQNKNGYIDLRRAIDNIQRSQNALINDMHKTKVPPANPGTFGGSGFAISSNGYIATNFHVIHNADSIYVQDSKGNAYKAKLAFQEPATDIAVLKIEDESFRLPDMPYRLSTSGARLGEEVYTLGYPKDDVVYGKGYISSATGFRGDTTAYQLSIPVNPGNSGGPLLDERGNLIGIISGKQSLAEDVAFAVKSFCLKNMLDSLPADFNQHMLINPKNTAGFARLSRVEQLKRLEGYVFLVKVYN